MVLPNLQYTSSQVLYCLHVLGLGLEMWQWVALVSGIYLFFFLMESTQYLNV